MMKFYNPSPVFPSLVLKAVRRGRSRGQSLTEFALVLPIALLLLALAATGGQMLATSIDLTQAARSGAIAAAADYGAGDTIVQQTTDARTAAYDEQGGAGSITCQSSAKVPVGCVGVTDTPGADYPGQNLAVVTVWKTLDLYVPLFPNITVSGTATAAAGS
jgi:Flp pilus assembly protein TadG